MCIYVYYIYSLNQYIYFIIYNSINFIDQYIDSSLRTNIVCPPFTIFEKNRLKNSI